MPNAGHLYRKSPEQDEILAQMAVSNDFRIPRNKAEALSALSMRRTGPDRRVAWYSFDIRERKRGLTFAEQAALHHENTHWDINVKPGNNLYVTVYSGIPFLQVRSGHVTIEFRSPWGNSVTVHDGASAHVIVPDADTKVTITVEAGGSYTMDIPEGKNRVYYPDKYPRLDSFA